MNTVAHLLATVDPRIGWVQKVGDQLCLFGFFVHADGTTRVDISTLDGADRTVLMVVQSEQTLDAVIAAAVDRHGDPSTWPVWASDEYVEAVRALESSL